MTTSVVTGVAGFLGSHLAERLLQLGHTVIGLDSLDPAYPRARKLLHLAPFRDHPQFLFIEGDLLRLDLARLLGGSSFIFHLAARPGVRQSWGRDFHACVEANIVATRALLEAAVAGEPRKFVYASSSSVYDPTAPLPWKEEAPTRPLSPYGVTKLAGEHLCRAYGAKYGLPVVCLRYFTVYGPRQRPDMAIQRFIEAILAGTEITVFGDGEQRRDFTRVHDAVTATILASRGETVPGEVVNVGTGRPVSLHEMIRCLADITGRTPRVRRAPAPPADPRETRADTTRASARLGFVPHRDISRGLEEQVAWTQEFLLGSRSTNSQAQ